MRELLLDVIKHTQGLGFIDTVKVEGTDKSTVFEAMESNKTVVLDATALKPEPHLAGSFGMGRLNILQGYLNFANYKTDEAKITVSRKDRDDKKDVPQEITFNDGNGQKSVYRFMSSDMIPYAKFKGSSWDVSVEPTSSKIKEFQDLAGILSGTEPYFLAKTSGGKLVFSIGEEHADNAEITIAEGVEGELKGELYWPTSEVISILKLGINENPKIDITSRGALQVTITSPYVEYKYILPARKR